MPQQVRYFLLAVSSAALLTGCSTSTSMTGPSFVDRNDASIRAYWNCGVAEARRLARRSSESAAVILVAAGHHCGAERQVVIDAVMREEHPDFWDVHANGLDRGFRDLVVSTVLESR